MTMTSWSPASLPGLVSMALFSVQFIPVISLIPCQMWNRPLFLDTSSCGVPKALFSVLSFTQLPYRIFLFPKSSPVCRWHSAVPFLHSDSLQLQYRSPSSLATRISSWMTGATWQYIQLGQWFLTLHPIRWLQLVCCRHYGQYHSGLQSRSGIAQHHGCRPPSRHEWKWIVKFADDTYLVVLASSLRLLKTDHIQTWAAEKQSGA